MRLAVNEHAWDRVVPIFVLPYAVWTMYVHLVTATHSSFTTLLQWLPLVLLLATAATIAWFRLPTPAERPAPAAIVRESPTVAAVGPTARERITPAAPFLVLALAVLWVGLLSAGMPYRVLWWVALLATGCAWSWQLRARPRGMQGGGQAKYAAWIVLGVIVAAVCFTLVVIRPALDDAFYLSIPATLLHSPQQPVLVHDTMYRLPDIPIMLPFYRLSNYNVLIGTVARVTGIDHLVVAHLVLPSLFAALCVLAWVYLLRCLVPERWPWVLLILFLCVVALGEAHRAYGNFAFVRMFEGKAILATCMVPMIAGSALLYVRHGGIRHWLLLFAAQIAALGITSSALFVAPATAALGLAGGWSPDATRSRRFVFGILASTYLFAAAWVMISIPHATQGLGSSGPMPDVPQILEHTWGPWSTKLLLVALLSAWAFVRAPVRARYFSAGAFCFLLAALNPYTVRFVADHFVGAATYWRLTWALPLPFFLAVILDDVIRRAPRLRPKVVAVAACLALAGSSAAFGWRSGTLRSSNRVTLGMPGLKVPAVEYNVARRVVEAVPEHGTVVAPQAVSVWLPIFVVHPELIGVRHDYLSLAFTSEDTAGRSNMMRYVGGVAKPRGTADSAAWFVQSLRRYRVTAVVLKHAMPWRNEAIRVMGDHGYRPLSCGSYEIWVKGNSGSPMNPAERGSMNQAACEPQPTPSTAAANVTN